MKSSTKQVDKIENALVAAYREQEDPQFPSDWRHRLMKHVRSLAWTDSVSEKESTKTIGFKRVLAIAATTVFAALLVWFTAATLDYHNPWVTLEPHRADMGRNIHFLLKAGDKDSGLRMLRVMVIQKTTEIEVLSRDFNSQEGRSEFGNGRIKQVEIPLMLDLMELRLQSGHATLMITVRDLSWRNWFNGRITTIEHNVFIYRNN